MERLLRERETMGPVPEATSKARKMLRLLGKVSRPCDILDVACGSGMYGATFARCIPEARLTLFDQAYVLETTRKIVDVPARYVEGDLFETPFGGPYDIVIASHVFHHFDRKTCAGLARKLAGALKPGGRLVVQEFVPDVARTRRLQPIMFAVTMLVWTESGDTYLARDFRKWFLGAGLRKFEHHALDMPGDMIVATKR